MQKTSGEGGEGVRSVLRALDLLALFDETHRSRTVRELIDESGLAKSTVVRLVATLEQRGLLWSRGDGRGACSQSTSRKVRPSPRARFRTPESVAPNTTTGSTRLK
ncbi:helix-turn-helix domain-containing protein [Streptomyces sparsogenes]|uniref:helix-turn-helix domain-containing protein n=1 Tax=Streptomyces sparsogenes TaxID=67365 RepID=UPI003325D1C2